jgi:hypothetical protein
MDWPELCEPLLFGPMLPPRYRLSGPGATPDARERFAQQLDASPRAPLDPSDIEALRSFGWHAAAARISGQTVSAAQPAGACRPARSPRSGSA